MNEWNAQQQTMQESKLFFHSSECSQKGGKTQRQGAMLFLIIEQSTISV